MNDADVVFDSNAVSQSTLFVVSTCLQRRSEWVLVSIITLCGIETGTKNSAKSGRTAFLFAMPVQVAPLIPKVLPPHVKQNA